MKLRARVVRVTDKATKNFCSTLVNGQIQKGMEMAHPTWVEIVEIEGDVYLNYLRDDLSKISDSWFETVAQAKESALKQFCIEPGQWVAVKG